MNVFFVTFFHTFTPPLAPPRFVLGLDFNPDMRFSAATEPAPLSTGKPDPMKTQLGFLRGWPEEEFQGE